MGLIEPLARSSIVLAAGLLAVWCSRGQSAAFRHWVLTLAIGLAALQPAIHLAVPNMPVTLPAAAIAPADGAGEAGIDARFEMLTSAAAMVGSGAGNVRTLALQIWIAGAALGLGVLAAGIAWLQWQTARATDAGPRWRHARDIIQRELAIAEPVRIAQARSTNLLVTWGVRRPAILLPAGADLWPDDRIRLVLLHELSHVARRDWLTQVAAEAVRAVYWINPLFWIASARLRIESERACDDVVLGSGIGGAAYASHLVDLARSFRGRRWLPAPSMARPSTLERRVVAMLNPDLARGPASRARKLAVAALVVMAALPIAAVTGTSGAPAGVLRDPSGRVLPGATVRLSAVGADAIHETQSDPTGAFQFPEVPDGDYMLSARLPGFSSGRQRIRVSAAMPPLDLTLQVGTLKETITVKGAAAAQATSGSARPMPARPACGSTELGGNIKPPLKLKDVRPRYKSEWIAAGLAGDVLLQAMIGKDGQVRNVEVISPVNADLEDEAINAVSQWEFSPTWLNCEAIEVRMFVTVRFTND